MTDPTIAAWSRESDLLFQLRQLREENERLKKEIANQDAMLEAAQKVIPPNLCLTNTNISDDEVVPLDITIGELRKVAAAIRARGTT
jgi:hypothetical protein